MSNFKNTAKLTLLVPLLALLSACASNIVVEGNIPEPLMQQMPVTAKLDFSEEFSNFTYVEKDSKRVIDTLQLGSAQKQLFRNVFSNAFLLSDDPLAQTELVITPSVLSLQYSAPRESALNIYEVFLKYRIKINTVSQGKLADWVINGYGKTPTAFLKGADAAFNAATNVALRDVGAQISIGLPLQKSIQSFVAKRSPVGTVVDGDSLDSLETKASYDSLGETQP